MAARGRRSPTPARTSRKWLSRKRSWPSPWARSSWIESATMSSGKKSVEAIYPLSPQQQGMLFETLAAPQSGVHVEQLTCHLEGELDRHAFARAWRALLDRHAILRTAFAWQDQAQPLQIVGRGVDMPLADE